MLIIVVFVSQNIQVLILVSKKFKQLKIGFRTLTVKSHKFWALQNSSHGYESL